MKRTFWIAAVAISLASPAFAQDPKDAAQGETREKMEAAAKVAAETAPVPAPPPAPPTGEWKANVGANLLLNTGNSESTNFGGSGLASYKWDRNKLETTAIGAYGRAKDNVTGTTTTNTKNWKIVERYDRYIWDPLSLFVFGHLGQDQPSGIDWRYGGSGGVSHEVIRTDPHFFKYEVGFDYTRELRLPPPDANLYSARLFLGYKFKLSDWATFGEDLENLFDLVDGKDYRLNSLTALTMKLTTKVGFQFGFQVRFDNVPVPGKKKLDTSTVAGLVVNIL